MHKHALNTRPLVIGAYIIALVLVAGVVLHVRDIASFSVASAQSLVRSGKLHWDGNWVGNNFSCDPGYTLKQYTYSCGCSNDATWFACVK